MPIAPKSEPSCSRTITHDSDVDRIGCALYSTGMPNSSADEFALHVGVKTDPIECRYSHEWLFHLLREVGVRHVQVGTFFELYQLPDDFFLKLRDQAESYGVSLSSVFTSHRELGGFFYGDGPWESIARKNYERLIRVASLLGAQHVGCNPGAVWRDRVDEKPRGVDRYLRHMRELMELAKQVGVDVLTIEPMSCLAEPPTLPDEIRTMAEDLRAYWKEDPSRRAAVGYCTDVSHGYVDADYNVRFDHFALMDAALPYTVEIHLRNTDRYFDKTFGFTAPERARGIVDVADVRDFYIRHSDRLPVHDLIGYLEIGGPKLGRDYSDPLLEDSLRESLSFLEATFVVPAPPVAGSDVLTGAERPGERPYTSPGATAEASTRVQVSPSIMCADLCHLESSVRQIERCGADMLHFDIMDAHFTPNMPLGLLTLEQLRPRTLLPFDVHLMVENNDFFVDALARIGVQSVSVHYESAVHLDRTLVNIRSHGIRAGVALNPGTPLTVLDYLIERLDFVLLMTVNPGFAGQALVPSAIRKIRDCSALLAQHGTSIPVEVDGNVSLENIPDMVAAGASILVAGSSSLFRSEGSLQENMHAARRAIDEGLRRRSGESRE